MASDLPCDGDGCCMVCKKTPPEPEVITCRTCATPWHVPCLSFPPETLASTLEWDCPDCSPTTSACPLATAAVPASGSGLVASIRAIEADGSLTEQEKARRRQDLLSRGPADDEKTKGKGKGKKKGDGGDDDVLNLLDDKFNCAFCMQLPDRPVTTPCGHNFCLKCFQKWVGQSKHTCAKCRAPIPSKMASQPRINSALVAAIRMAKTAKLASSGSTTSAYQFVRNENRPDKAFTTERAKKTGKANACSGQIFVTVPPDHFGPILAPHDPKRNRGVLVGELWEDRMECRQWGAHLPHVAGIAGQCEYGAQSVALSGGYEDDEDHGEWFLYTGSGGRDLSGNKRTNKDQAFDQKFEKLNEALRISCKRGYPVRVVRSHKEKRSSYAPESGVRYDGIFRIEKCWRKVGIQGFKVCRYLFVRCDNEPAPWTSDEQGDRPRPLPAIKELKNATDITVRKENPAWDYDEKHGWRWVKPPPPSRKLMHNENSERKTRGRKKGCQTLSVSERLLKEFGCLVCRKVMTYPLTTPCAHNFCKPCLLGSYADQSFMRERSREGGRTLRAQKIVKNCPVCPNDVSDFLQNPQVNRELMDLIESLQRKAEEDTVEGSCEEESDVLQKSDEDGSGDVAGNELNNYVSDSMDDELGEDESDDMKSKRLIEKVSDVEEDKKFQSIDKDSETNSVISQIKDSGHKDCPTDMPSKTIAPASGKKKQTFAEKRASKKARKSEEVNNGFEDKIVDKEANNQYKKVGDAAASSIVEPVNSEISGEKCVQVQASRPNTRANLKQKKAIEITRKREKSNGSKKDSVASPSCQLDVQPDDDDDDFQ